MSTKGAFAVCEKHGTEVMKGLKKMVRCPVPKNKSQRFNIGCPQCASERRVAEKEAQGQISLSY